MNIIEINNLTKDYGHQRGIFNVNLSVTKGQCYGFLGPNGAGKTTTIRHLMGFSKPQDGSCFINNQDTWKQAASLKGSLGYLPGEISFPIGMTGHDFLIYMKKLRKIKDMSYCEELIRRFELNTDMPIDKMSLGVKRKLAVVTAFMHDPDILILDEPTSGLDPIMQQMFIDFIIEEKKRGKTILLSSHIFHEVDAVCDKISIIKQGKIVSTFKMDELRSIKQRIYLISFFNNESFETFINKKYSISSKNEAKYQVRIVIDDSDINDLITDLSALEIKDFAEVPFTLEDYFMQFYKENNDTIEVI